HYPSRTECMVCHSRAANFVLGLTALQMNKVHDYGGVRDNQLRTLEHLGVLRVDWAEETRALIREDGEARGLKGKELDAFVQRQTETRLQSGPEEASGPTAPPGECRRLGGPYGAT